MGYYDVIVIGFGKAGKTLAVKLAKQGKKVAVIEEDSKMYGGTCINIGCIPTKTLLTAAANQASFDEAMAEKNAVVTRLNGKNLAMVDAIADVYHAHATFVDNKTIEITSQIETKRLRGDIIIINTGATNRVLPIDGLATSQQVYDSTGIQQLKQQPKTLGIIGGGNIGLEFANLYATLGSKVTIFEASSEILSKAEPVVRDLAMQYMTQQGMTCHVNVNIKKVYNQDSQVIIETADNKHIFDAVLYATGRVPNTKGLGLENTDILVDERGIIQVDEFCQTAVPNVFAVGDVKGGLQFTYVSLDDSRIVFNYLNGNTEYSLQTRRHIPTTTFINPPLSQIGITEQQAKDAGLPYAAKEILVSGMPRGHVNADLRGVYKAIVNTETKEILGATLYAKNSEEVINLLTMAMDNKIPYTYFTNQMFTHPTMAENLNDLFMI